MRAAFGITSGNLKPNIGRKLVLGHLLLFLVSIGLTLAIVLPTREPIWRTVLVAFVFLTLAEFVATPLGYINLAHVCRKK